MQHIKTNDISQNGYIQDLTISDNTSAKLMIRLPIIIEKLAQGLSVDEIARDLGIHRSNVYRTLRKVEDFAPIVDLAVERVIENTELLDDPDRKAWHYGRLIQTLHSKKIVGEMKHTTHNISEDVKTLRVILKDLDQDTVDKLDEALKRKTIDADYTVKSDDSE